MSTHARLREVLGSQRESILRRVGAIESDLRHPHAADWVEHATELENDEVLEGLDAMGLEELRQISGALRRIDEGTYAACVRCQEPIGEGRLHALPTASMCLRCAAGHDAAAPIVLRRDS